MPSPIDELRAKFDEQLSRSTTEAELKALRDEYLGRKGGAIAALMKQVAAAPSEVRPGLGREANTLKQFVEGALAERRAALEARRAPAGSVDVTLPGRTIPPGGGIR